LRDPGRQHFLQAPVVDRKAAQAGLGNIVAGAGAWNSHIEKVLSRNLYRESILDSKVQQRRPRYQVIQVFFSFYVLFLSDSITREVVTFNGAPGDPL
jgi:hypothetical protein